MAFHPSAASSAFVMLFTASSTSMQFTLYGMLDCERNFALPMIGVISAVVGSTVIGRVVRCGNVSVAPFYTKTRKFAQDRLGTDIGKALKKLKKRAFSTGITTGSH